MVANPSHIPHSLLDISENINLLILMKIMAPKALALDRGTDSLRIGRPWLECVL